MAEDRPFPQIGRSALAVGFQVAAIVETLRAVDEIEIGPRTNSQRGVDEITPEASKASPRTFQMLPLLTGPTPAPSSDCPIRTYTLLRPCSDAQSTRLREDVALKSPALTAALLANKDQQPQHPQTRRTRHGDHKQEEARNHPHCLRPFG
jgi:hypothetical protein